MRIISTTRDGQLLARRLKCEFSLLQSIEYPDGEVSIRLPKGIEDQKVILFFKFDSVQSFDEQILNLLALLYERQGKQETKLILPYLPYCRSYPSYKNEVDKLAYILHVINESVDEIILLNPHAPSNFLKRHLKNPIIKYIDIEVSIIKLLDKKFKDPVLISPDQGFKKFVTSLAKASNKKFFVLSKKRLSPSKVLTTVSIKDKGRVQAVKNKQFVILDDIVSTGTTLLKAKASLRSLGVKNVQFFAIHNTAKTKAKTKMRILTTNSIDNHNFDLDINEDIHSMLLNNATKTSSTQRETP